MKKSRQVLMFQDGQVKSIKIVKEKKIAFQVLNRIEQTKLILQFHVFGFDYPFTFAKQHNHGKK